MHQFFQFIFEIKLYMFQTVPLSIIRSFTLYTQQWYMSHRFTNTLRAGPDVPSWSCSQAVWHISLLCVQWKIPDDGQRNCLKHVEFYFKNKLKKLVHLVGFIISNYHDARSTERQKSHQIFIINYIMLYVLMKSWSNFLEDGDNVETCSS